MDLFEYFQLRNIRRQQEKANVLLEEIRRLQLSPAQRDAEDRQREANDRQREVDDKAHLERANADAVLALGLGFSIIGIVFLIIIFSHPY